MLLTYHDDLLSRSIPLNYFDGLTSQFGYVNSELLTAGLRYPDVPCNELVITSPENKVKYLNYNTCRIPLPLLYLFDEEGNGLKQTVQSHRGRQAIGHSMTFDPSVKMIDIRQKILRRLEILYMLALQDDSLITKCKNENCEQICYKSFFSNYTSIVPQPNIFWVGQILHCIQDSYSRVHTLRTQPQTTQSGGEPHRTTKEAATNASPFSDKETNLPSFKLVKIIGDLVDSTQLEGVSLNTKEDIVAFLIKNITEPELQKIIRKNPNDISHILKLTLFFKNQKKRILALYGNDKNTLPSEKNKANHRNNNVNYPYLRSFRYIYHQKKCGRSFHMSYDTKKENTAFDRFIIENCKEVLEMFKRHVSENADISLTVKINEMIAYVANNVFPIKEGYQDKPSVEECPSNDCGCRVGGKKIRSKKRKPYRKRYVSKTRSKRKT